VAREFLQAAAQIEQPEMTGIDDTTTGADEKLATTLQHLNPHLVDVRAEKTLRAPNTNVVAGVGPSTATAMRGQQIIPAIVINQIGGFAIDRDVHRLVVWVHALAGPGIKLNQPNVTKVGSVNQPQPAVVRIQIMKHSTI